MYIVKRTAIDYSRAHPSYANVSFVQVTLTTSVITCYFQT